MRLSIRYVTHFAYPEPAWDSHNVLRACPADDQWQRRLDYRLAVQPAAWVTSHVDAWGTRVDAFGVRERHRELRIVADSRVETIARPQPTGDACAVPRAALGDAGFREANWRYLQPSRHVRAGEPVVEVARAASGDAATVVEVARRIHERVHGALVYQPGATVIGVDVNEVLAGGAGVCQDYVHLALAMYRTEGVPARYVSGYFYAIDEASGEAPDALDVTVQTHAWVEVAIPGWGWWALDPTNLLAAGERHVKIGHGRDYDDVLPLRGVYYGTTQQQLFVAVGMSRGEPPDLVRQMEQQ